MLPLVNCDTGVQGDFCDLCMDSLDEKQTTEETSTLSGILGEPEAMPRKDSAPPIPPRGSNVVSHLYPATEDQRQGARTDKAVRFQPAEVIDFLAPNNAAAPAVLPGSSELDLMALPDAGSDDGSPAGSRGSELIHPPGLSKHQMNEWSPLMNVCDAGCTPHLYDATADPRHGRRMGQQCGGGMLWWWCTSTEDGGWCEKIPFRLSLP